VFIDLKPLLEPPARDLVRSLTGRFGAARWTILPVAIGAQHCVYGIVLGRRTANSLGVVAVLALRRNGLLRFTLVPVEGEVPIFPELEVREAFVRASRLPIAPHGHPFVESLVLAGLCSTCGGPWLPHERARVEKVITYALAPMEVSVTYADQGVAVVRGVSVRLPEIASGVARHNPIPGPDGNPVPAVEQPAPKPRPWSDLEGPRLRDLALAVRDAVIFAPNLWSDA